MESGSQCPARFNIVNFPGKLEKKRKQAEKLKHNSLGESEACKVDTVLKVMTNSYHHCGESVAAPTIADYALQQECKSRTELLAG